MPDKGTNPLSKFIHEVRLPLFYSGYLLLSLKKLYLEYYLVVVVFNFKGYQEHCNLGWVFILARTEILYSYIWRKSTLQGKVILVLSCHLDQTIYFFYNCGYFEWSTVASIHQLNNCRYVEVSWATSWFTVGWTAVIPHGVPLVCEWWVLSSWLTCLAQ